MCGILMTQGVDAPFSHRLLSSLSRRGPDGIGFWTKDGVNLAHTRLAIIGLDERGMEPKENDTHVLTYNGEIYNFGEIRRRLEAEKGLDLRGANDADVLLHGWSAWGPRILEDMVGFWAFTIYDKMRGVVTLVRDQLGIKPLYYWHGKGMFGAASMIRTLLEVMPGPVELDYQALSEYARYQLTFGDKTFVRQVRKVPPGHLVSWNVKTGELQVERYEDILRGEDDEIKQLTTDWLDETRELIREAAIDSTISDTSFTTFCSGGVDSSLITTITAPEIAYHANFSDPDCNETFYAQRVVEKLDTRLFVVNAQEQFNLVERLASIVEDFDELTVGSVILPLDDLLAEVKRRYKVILTGTGGDELFGGYVRYPLVLGSCYQESYRPLFERMKGIAQEADRFELTHRKGNVALYKFYDPAAEESFQEAYEEARGGGTHLDAMLRFDRRHFLQGLLNIDDKMGARHSLETRPSLLHQRVVRHVRKLEPEAFLANGELKPVLRDIAAGILPRAISHRTDKMGFTTPIGDFINRSADHIRAQLEDSPFRDFYDLRKTTFTASTKYSREVFGLLMLDLWLNRYARP